MLKYIPFILILLFSTYTANAQEQTKILLHMNDTFKYKHLQKSVKNIREELGANVDIRIVINGKAVQSMLKNDRYTSDIVSDILKRNAKIGLCHNALRNNKVNKSMLIKGVNILSSDGNVEIIRLRKKGYIYIKI
jgi:intracellular sulfur oxidation DsrE/DsrF family protein